MQAVHDLGVVVSAMRGMAAARVEQARSRREALRIFAEAVDFALRTTLAVQDMAQSAAPAAGRRAVVLFCAEQGFAGAFSERVLDQATDLAAGDQVLLVGTRGREAAARRGRAPTWSLTMPARPQNVTKLADQIVEHLSPGLASASLERVEVVFTAFEAGMPLRVHRETLLPLAIPAAHSCSPPPLMQLPPRDLLVEFLAAHLHARICNAALCAFEAEAQARMEIMAAAHRHIDNELATLQGVCQQLRQEDITAEIIELASGQLAGASGLA